MKNILLAVDGSKLSKDAARFLSRVPHEQTIEITVLTVIETPVIAEDYPVQRWINDAVQQERAAATRLFAEIEAMFAAANVQLRHEIRDGRPGAQIVQAAKELACELVVVGAVGKSVVDRIVLGSTSDYVATHASCSVLLFRPTGLLDSNRPIRVTVAYEDTPTALAATEEFADFPWGRGADVDVISIASNPFGLGHQSPHLAAIQAEMQSALDRATARVAHVGANTRSHLLQEDHVGESIVRFAQQHQADLLVIGEAHRTALGRFLMGSVSRFVIRHARCSVWITRNRLPKHGVESVA